MIDGVVDNTRGYTNEVAGVEVIAVISIGVLAGAREDVEQFFTIGVIVWWVLLARFDNNNAKSLLCIGI